MKNFLLILIATVLFVAVSCQPQPQQSPEEYRNEVKQKITELDKLWMEAWENEDLDSVLFFVDDDFINMFNDTLDFNKEQCREGFKSVFANFSIEDLEYKTVEIIVGQGYSFETQLFKQKWITNDKQDTVFFDLRLMLVFKKQVDGSWKLFREIGQQ